MSYNTLIRKETPMIEKKSTLWGNIFTDLTDDNGCHELGEVNFYQLASHLEDLYVLIADLQSEVNQLKKDNELLKSYAWEQ